VSWQASCKYVITLIALTGLLTGTLSINYFEDAEALKSKGNPIKKFGLATKHLVCGDRLCSESQDPSNLESIKTLESLIFFDCNSDVMCIIDHLKEIDKEKGQLALISEFNEIISVLEDNMTYCHAPAHHLGKFLYGHIGDLRTAISVVDSRCGGAIYHGILENFFTIAMLDFTNLDEIKPSTICPIIDNEFSRDRYECLHGLGHGLTVFYGYDIFEAIKHCGDFSYGWEMNSCSNGVFMENIVRYLALGDGTFDEDDIFYPCNKMDPKYAPACYHHQNTFILVQNNYSIPDSFDDCDKIIPQEFVKYCYRGMGRQLAPVSSSIEIPIEPMVKFSRALEICQNGQTQFQTNCLTGLVRVIIDQESLDKGFEYCKFFPEQFKYDCYNLLGVWIQMSYDSKNDQSEQCSKAENSNYFEICLNSTLEDWELIQG